MREFRTVELLRHPPKGGNSTSERWKQRALKYDLFVRGNERLMVLLICNRAWT
jgi:hypothetical protein